MYHVVSEPNSPHERKLACTPTAFKKQMRYLKKEGFRVISLGEAATALEKGSTLPEKSVLITFDDGYIDTYENAYPILKKFGFPATIFIVSDLVGESNQWIQREGGSPRKLCNWNQLREMAGNGMEIGSHTATHIKLSDVNSDTAYHEIIDSKKTIETSLGIQAQFFAYPYGLYKEEHKKLVKHAGYRVACSTHSGFNNLTEDTFMLRRIDVTGSDSLLKFKFKLKFGVNRVDFSFIAKYYQSRLISRLKKQQ
jgi:peptidoglycan/xylan/chitin deacetylase (PgdA/CDA1 family)